ncbi:MAG: hypothetical protein AABY64_14640 [Bdellovibrionota bacterium]
MNKSILKTFLAICITTSSALSAFAQENEEYRQGGGGTLKVDRTKLTENEKVRRDQLLKQSALLNENYTQTIEKIEETQKSLEIAKQKCQDQCTSAELKEAMNSMNSIAVASTITLTIANGLRWFIGMFARAEGQSEFARATGENQFRNGVNTITKPWKTIMGVGILTSVAIIGVNKLAEGYITAKDGSLLRNIDEVQKELAKYHEELTTINSQISVINTALTQVIKIEQRTRVEQNVGYDK